MYTRKRNLIHGAAAVKSISAGGFVVTRSVLKIRRLGPICLPSICKSKCQQEHYLHAERKQSTSVSLFKPRVEGERQTSAAEWKNVPPVTKKPRLQS